MRNAFRRAVTTRLARAIPLLATPALATCAALLSGCGGDDAVQAPPVPTARAEMKQENNFSYSSTLTIPPPTKTAPEVDLAISWDMVATDLQGHAYTTDNVDEVAFLPVRGTDQMKIAGSLNSGDFGQDDLKGGSGGFVLKPTADQKSATLSEFESIGEAGVHPDPHQDYNVDPDNTYLLVFQSGTQLGHGARTMMFLLPKDGETKEDVSAQADSSSMLSFSADLKSLTHLSVAADSIVDWAKVTLDGQGKEIAVSSIDSVHVGFYADRDVDSLQTKFLNLEQDTVDEGGPDMSWEISVASGSKAAFVDGMGRHGEEPFTSFDTGGQTGTWLLAGFCSGCQNPAPLIVTILDPQ